MGSVGDCSGGKSRAIVGAISEFGFAGGGQNRKRMQAEAAQSVVRSKGTPPTGVNSGAKSSALYRACARVAGMIEPERSEIQERTNPTPSVVTMRPASRAKMSR